MSAIPRAYCLPYLERTVSLIVRGWEGAVVSCLIQCFEAGLTVRSKSWCWLLVLEPALDEILELALEGGREDCLTPVRLALELALGPVRLDVEPLGMDSRCPREPVLL